MKKRTLIASVLILVTFLLVPVICASQNSQSISSFGTITSSPTGSTKIKKMLLAWGAQNATSLVQFMQRSSTGWDLIFMDGPPDLAPSLVAAVKAAYPSIKLLTSVSVVSIANAGYDDYNTADSTYWGYQILNPYDQYKYVGYDGVFLDDMYAPSTLPNGTAGPTYNDLSVLASWLRARLPTEIMVTADWSITDSTFWLFIHSFDNPNYPFQEANITQIEQATAQGRIVVVGPATEYGDGYTDTLQECTYVLAHFLLGLNGNNGYFSWSANYPTDTNTPPNSPSRGWYSIMDTDPGTPLNAYQTSGSWIYRNFTKCNVQANPTTRTGIITMLS